MGLPDPHDPADMTLAGDVLSRPGVIERVLEVHGQNPLHVTPGPDRRALEELLT